MSADKDQKKQNDLPSSEGISEVVDVLLASPLPEGEPDGKKEAVNRAERAARLLSGREQL